MRQYKEEKTKAIEKIFCNKCGKELINEGVFQADFRWGYFSNKDNEVHHFDLCEECYDEMIAAFRTPVEIENR